MAGTSLEDDESIGPDPTPLLSAFARTVWVTWRAPSAGSVRFWTPPLAATKDSDEGPPQQRLVLHRLGPGGSGVKSLTILATSRNRESVGTRADVVVRVAAADVVIVQLLTELVAPVLLSWRMSCTWGCVMFVLRSLACC
jgi:hypothetical protein